MATNYHNLSVVSFESRRAEIMVELIQRFGGQPTVVPTVCEEPVADAGAAREFGQMLEVGEVDVVILNTGVGVGMLAESIGDEFTKSLDKVTTIARGPKVVAALGKLGLSATYEVGEPHTWQEIVELIDAECPVDGETVAVQEYGQENPDLVAAIEERGGKVVGVPVYQWTLPEDTGPIVEVIEKMIDGGVDVALFTAAAQADHLFRVAEQANRGEALMEAFKGILIGSVGPVTTETIMGLGLAVDYEVDITNMKELVRETSRVGAALLEKKRVSLANGVDTNKWERIDTRWVSEDGKAYEKTIEDSVFMKACRREPVPYTPIWIMRQAGRYQRVYREFRKHVTMRDFCCDAKMCAEVTLMAAERLGVDAAIIFSDLMVIAEPFGLSLKYAPGPVITPAIRSMADVEAMKEPDLDELSYTYEALSMTRKALRPDIALLGFAGAPFTAASYLIEGGGSRNYIHTKTMMYHEPKTWDALMHKLTDMIAKYLNRQIEAGADAVQIFDSWAGCLSPGDYAQYVKPHVKRMIGQVTKDAPLIHFTTGNPALLPHVKEAGGDVFGVDWRVDMADAWAMFGQDNAVMGNMDPTVLFSSHDEIRRHAKAVLNKVGGQDGHIFNLGHGCMPGMSPTLVADLVDIVHEESAR